MSDYLKVHDELTRFASNVPDKSAWSQTFHTDELGGQMPGIQAAAEAHSSLMIGMEQFVNQADDGLGAFKTGAHDADAAYSGTDAKNAAAMVTAATGRLDDNTAPVGARGDMAAPGHNSPEGMPAQVPTAPVAPAQDSDMWDIPDTPYTGSDRLPTPWVTPAEQDHYHAAPIFRH